MRVAVFDHPFSDFYTSPARLCTAAVSTHLASLIPEHEVRCFSVHGRKPTPAQLPEELRHLSTWTNGDQSAYAFFSKYYRFGHVENFNHRELARFSPQCFLVTSFAWCYFDGFCDQVAYLKNRHPDIPVIAGGPGPSCDPAFYLSNSPVDAVVKGPAEPVLNALLRQIETGTFPRRLAGVFFRGMSGAAMETPPPAPLRPFVSLHPRRKTIQLQVTRGCPGRCAYCSIRSNSPGKWQRIPVETVMAALEPYAQSDSLHFNFEDDNLTFDRSYFTALITAVKSRFSNATFSAENGIDVTTLDASLIDFVHQAGFTGLNLSLTSASTTTLKRCGRTDYLEHLTAVIGQLHAHGIFVIVYYICGLPEDSVSNVFRTLQFLVQHPVLIGISPYYPVPGTPLVENAPPLRPILCRGSSFYPHAALSTETMVTFFMFTRAINFLKSTTDNDWTNVVSQRQNLTDRRRMSMLALCHSFGSKQLTGYRVENKIMSMFPYALNTELSRQLFDMIGDPEIPLVNLVGETLDKRLWQ